MDYGLIKEIAKKRGLSIRQLCKRIDITEQGYYKMIKKGSMSIKLLESITTELDISPLVLLAKNNQPPRKKQYKINNEISIVNESQVEYKSDVIHRLNVMDDRLAHIEKLLDNFVKNK